jgi:endonuclease/exonuclease/phosphatase (EEP) superfamily protein YafD
MIETRKVASPQSRRKTDPSWLSPGWPLLFLVVVWAGERLVGERWWVTTWALYLPQPLFLLPSLGLILISLLLRCWSALVGHLAVALLGVGLLFGAAYRLPQQPRRGDVRVMTWNVMALLRDQRGVLAAIRSEAPDVLLLQEVNARPREDPVDWLRQRLRGWDAVRSGDVAILSPHPLGPARATSLGPQRSRRVALQAPVRIRGRTAEVIVTHFHTALPRPLRERVWQRPRFHMQVAAAVRAEQTDNLVRVVRAAGRPLIVGGDFNSPPGSYAYRRLSERLQSAFSAGGWGFGWSFPAQRPLLRIDHLFVSPEFRVLQCRVLPLTVSDHRPVVADLDWR